MVLTGKQIFKSAKLGKLVNRKIVKYGKIGDNIGFEMTTYKNYDNENVYALAFVEYKNNKFNYDTNNGVEGTLEEMLAYIKQCKEEKKIIKYTKK